MMLAVTYDASSDKSHKTHDGIQRSLRTAIHDRMPVILEPKDYARWLGEEPTEPPQLMMMLKPYPANAMEAYPVSTRVGSVKNTGAALFEPLESRVAMT
jgi:putative SOS response-associated peptidase YedK